MAKMGRPRKDFNKELFEELCSIQCTEKEIAAVLKMDIDTMNKRVKEIYGHTFSDVFAEKREGGKSSVRRRQYQKALDGDTTMLIWLGKNMLDQKDKQEIESNVSGNIEVTFSDPDLDKWSK